MSVDQESMRFRNRGEGDSEAPDPSESYEFDEAEESSVDEGNSKELRYGFDLNIQVHD